MNTQPLCFPFELKRLHRLAFARLAIVFLVLALHWIALNAIASKLKTPLRTDAIPQTKLLMEWVKLETIVPHANVANKETMPTPAMSPETELLHAPVNDSRSPANDLNVYKTSEADVKDQGWNPLLYRSSPELDTRAAPTIDWIVNHQTQPKEGISVLVVTVWISASGVIDHFQLEQQHPSGDWAMSVLASFQNTVMEPATVAGIPVPSTMTIEITLNNETQ